jgi:hypothetical protein
VALKNALLFPYIVLENRYMRITVSVPKTTEGMRTAYSRDEKNFRDIEMRKLEKGHTYPLKQETGIPRKYVKLSAPASIRFASS